MTTIRHAIKIDAPRDRVFKALTDPGELEGWHFGPIEGDVAVGAVITMEARPGMRFGWKTNELDAGTRIVQEAVSGPGQTGKTVSFDLSDTNTGGTLVQLADGEWAEDDAHMPFCNTHWGNILHRLKRYVESGSA